MVNELVDTFAHRLNIAIEESGMTRADVSRKTGISRAQLTHYCSGSYRAKQDKLYLLAKALNVEEAYLMGYDVPKERSFRYDDFPGAICIPETNSVPLVGTIACGTPILAEQNITDYIQAPVKCDFCLTCKGDSMVNARICDGDTVFIKKQEDVDNGEIAAVIIGDEATLKRVYKAENGIILQPENPKYQPIICTGREDIRIVGKAVAFLSPVK